MLPCSSSPILLSKTLSFSQASMLGFCCWKRKEKQRKGFYNGVSTSLFMIFFLFPSCSSSQNPFLFSQTLSLVLWGKIERKGGRNGFIKLPSSMLALCFAKGKKTRRSVWMERKWGKWFYNNLTSKLRCKPNFSQIILTLLIISYNLTHKISTHIINPIN